MGVLVAKPRRLSTPATLKITPIVLKSCGDRQSLVSIIPLSQIVAPDFIIIAQIDAPVGECRVRPDQHAAANLVSRLYKPDSADFLVPTWIQVSDNQITKIIR